MYNIYIHYIYIVYVYMNTFDNKRICPKIWSSGLWNYKLNCLVSNEDKLCICKCKVFICHLYLIIQEYHTFLWRNILKHFRCVLAFIKFEDLGTLNTGDPCLIWQNTRLLTLKTMKMRKQNNLMLIFHRAIMIPLTWTHFHWTKWPPFSRRNFQKHFLEWSFFYFD